MQKGKIKTEWDLSVFYKSITDPKIDKDLETFKKACEAFEQKYKNNTEYLKDEKVLFEALVSFEKLNNMPESIFPMMYFDYKAYLDSRDTKVKAKATLVTQSITNSTNKIIFFEVTLGSISKEKQESFLKSKLLEKFNYSLICLFKESAHKLTEAEEKIISLKQSPARSLWIDGQSKLYNEQLIAFKGKKIPLSEASNTIPALKTKERRALHEKYMLAQKNISHFAESELNALVINKKIDDELRGFKKPYDATILNYQNSEETVLNLISTVTKNFSVAHKFYAIKAKMLNEKILTYADRNVSIENKEKVYSYTDSYELIYQAFKNTDKDFSNILERIAKNGQIDVFPRSGKWSGAFCSRNVGTPTMILLNHVNTTDSVTTFAHEMGHAIHAELSKSQEPIYQGHTTSVGEVASTFFENIAFEEILKTLTEKEKIIALHDRIQDEVNSVFRQTACFNFELDLHNTIRKEGTLAKEEIAEMMNKHVKAYLGPKFKLTENDGYFFVGWPHLRRFFYVYSYVYGKIISNALYKRYKDDSKYIHEIKKFLSAGGSKSPEQIFKDIGIDTSDPKFFEEGLKTIENNIDRLKKMIGK